MLHIQNSNLFIRMITRTGVKAVIGFIICLRLSFGAKLRREPSKYAEAITAVDTSPDPANLMALGETYSKESGFGYSDTRNNTSKTPVYLGTPPKDTPRAILEIVSNLMSSPGLQSCSSDIDAPGCAVARELLEKQMYAILETMVYTTPERLTNIRSLFRKLDLAERQLAKMRATVLGEGSIPGLQKNIALLGDSITQFDAKAEGAYGNIIKVMSDRRALMESEKTRLSDLEKNAKSTLEQYSKRLIAANARKAAARLNSVMKSIGKSLSDFGNQANYMSSDWSSGLDELDRGYTTWLNDTTTLLDLERGVADTARDDARVLSKSMNSTAKISSQQVLAAAASEQGTWQRLADASLKTAAKTKQKRTEDKSQEILQAVNSTIGELVQEMNGFEFKRYPVSKQLRLAVDSFIPWGSARVKAAVSDSLDEASSLSKNLKSIYLSQKIDEISKSISDQTSQVLAQGQMVKDSIAATSLNMGQTVSAAATAAAEDVGQIKSDAEKSVSRFGDELQSTGQSMRENADSIKDSGMSGVASIQIDSAESMLAGANGLVDATDSVLTGSALNNAKLKSITDAVSHTLSGSSRTLTAALMDERDTLNEITAATSADTLAQMDSLTVKPVVLDIPSAGTDLSKTIQENQREYSNSVVDGQEAISRVSTVSKSLQAQLTSAASGISESSQDDKSTVSRLLSSMATQESMVNSSIAGAQSVLASQLSLLRNPSELFKQVEGLSQALKDDIRAVLKVIGEKIQDSKFSVADTKVKLIDDVAQLGVLLNAIDPRADSGAYSNAVKSEKNLEAIEFIRKVRNISQYISGKFGAVESDIDAQIRAKSGSVESEISKSGNSVLSRLEKDQEQLLSQSNDTDSLLERVSVNTGTVEREFEKFNQRINTSRTDLGTISDGAASLLYQTNQDVSSILGRVLQGLAQQVSHVKTVSTNASVESESRIDRAIQSVDESSEVTSDYASDASVQFKSAQDMIQQESENHHQRMLQAIKSVDRTVTDIRRSLLFAIASDRSAVSEAQIQVLKALSGLPDGTDGLMGNVRGEIDQHRKEVSNQLIEISKRLGVQLEKLKLLAAQKELGADTKLLSFISSLEQEIGGSEANLNASRDFFLGALKGDRSAESGKQVYSLSGMLRNMSLKNRGKLQALLQQVSSGQITIEEAVTQARSVDINSIKNTNDAVSLLIAAMMDYQQNLYRVFGDSQARLDNTTSSINTYLDAHIPATLANLDQVSQSSSNTSQAISDLSNTTDITLQNDSDQIAQIENKMEQNRTAINIMLGDIGNQIDLLEGEMKTDQLDFENWIDSKIAQELGKAHEKAENLKQSLNLTSSVSSSSLVELREADALSMEIRELGRRSQLRKVIAT